MNAHANSSNTTDCSGGNVEAADKVFVDGAPERDRGALQKALAEDGGVPHRVLYSSWSA